MSGTKSTFRFKPVKKNIVGNATVHLETGILTESTKIWLGNCGDAWRLTSCGAAMDVIDHRPFYKNKKTPVGLCCDAPILILYPERGKINWEELLQQRLRNGKLASGADIKVIYLTNQQYKELIDRKYLRLSFLKKLVNSK